MTIITIPNWLGCQSFSRFYTLMSGLAWNWVKLAPYGTNLGKVSVYFGSASQNVLKLFWKSHRFIPFGGQSHPIWSQRWHPIQSLLQPLPLTFSFPVSLSPSLLPLILSLPLSFFFLRKKIIYIYYIFICNPRYILLDDSIFLHSLHFVYFTILCCLK